MSATHKPAVNHRQPLRPVELGCGEAAVGLAGPSTADAIDLAAVVRRDDDLVMIRIADEQALRRGEHLARKLQGGVGDAFCLQLRLKRCPVDLAALVEDPNHGLDRLFEPLVVPLA